jgi:4-hydroxy-tetrahydrodipicolinate reductase
MKIALIGYGKMGHAIESIALQRGHEIVARIDVDNKEDIDSDLFRSADVAIEFTAPTQAYDNCSRALAQGVAVVSGSTGWLDKLEILKEKALKGEATLFYSSNYSVGMNIFMAVNKYLARIMTAFSQYKPAMEETHHIHKLDHPSGTAVTLAQDLIATYPKLNDWHEVESLETREEATLPIKCYREGEVPGIHTITWDAPEDFISITHSAKSRMGFALGAVLAAEWVCGRKGYFTMADMMAELENA